MPITPRRVYDRDNLCVLCGFSFVHTEISEEGVRKEVKLFKQKLKITDDRVEIIQKILPNFAVRVTDKNNGICVKCFKNVEKAIKLHDESMKIKSELEKSRSTVIASSTKKLAEKRLLRSPFSDVSKKKQFPSTVKVKRAVQVAPLSLLVLDAGASASFSFAPVQPDTQTQFVPIAAKQVGDSSQIDSAHHGEESTHKSDEFGQKSRQDEEGNHISNSNTTTDKVTVSLPASLSVVPVPSLNFIKPSPESFLGKNSGKDFKNGGHFNSSYSNSDLDLHNNTKFNAAEDKVESFMDDSSEREEDDVLDDSDVILLDPNEDGIMNSSDLSESRLDYHDNQTGDSNVSSDNQPVSSQPLKVNFSFQSKGKKQVLDHMTTNITKQNLSYNLLQSEENSNTSSESDALVKRKRVLKQINNQCKYCKKTIDSWEAIVEHALSDHGMMSGDTDEVACPVCKGLFSKRNMSTFIQHVQLHDKNFRESQNEAKSSKTMSSSSSGHEKRRPCSSYINSNQTFARQKSFLGPKSAKLEHLHRNKFSRKSFPRLNARITHESLKCIKCNMSLNSYAEILNHCKQHDMFKQCPVRGCGKQFTLRGGLLRHFITHVDTRIFACPNCPSGFTRKDNLKRHVETGCGKFKKDGTPTQTLKNQSLKPKTEKKMFKVAKRKLSSNLQTVDNYTYDIPQNDVENQPEHSYQNDRYVEMTMYCNVDIKSEPLDPEENIQSLGTTQYSTSSSKEPTPDSQMIQVDPLESAEVIPETRSNINTSRSSTPDRSVLSYACGTCDVSFTSLIQLKRHVVMCHSEENPVKSSNYSINQEMSADTGSYHSDMKVESVSYDDGNMDDSMTQQTIKQELQDMDVIDIESLGQLTSMPPDSQNYVQDEHGSGGDDVRSYSPLCNQVSFTVEDDSSSSVVGTNESSTYDPEDQSFQNIRQSDSEDQGPSTSIDKSFEETCTELFLASQAGPRRKSQLHKTTPICHYCGMLFEKGLDVVHHNECHITKISSLSTCVICLKELSGKDSLLRHANSHIGRWFTCHVCMASFSRKDNLKRHIKKNHEDVIGDLNISSLIEEHDSSSVT